MTRYLCIDPGHGRGDEVQPVDLSAMVRTELGYLSEEIRQVVAAQDVVRAVMELDVLDKQRRVSEIRRVLSGTAEPSEAAVTLIDQPSGPNEDIGPAGSTTVPQSDLSSDVIRLPDSPATHAGPGPRAATATRTHVDEQSGAPAALPQGTFPVSELAARLASARPETVAIIEAIERTPAYEELEHDMPGHPWRVVVECPQAEGSPPTHHRVVFAGTGEPGEPDVVFGTPAAGWDLVLEDAATEDLAPPLVRRRAERLLAITLVTELVVAMALLGIAWASGGLGLAARESPGWLGAAVALTLGAVAVAIIALVAPRETDGNPNDTLVVDAFYESRSTMVWTGTVLSVGLFVVALLLAVVPPMLARQTTLPAPSISFDTMADGTVAIVSVSASDVSTDEVVTLDVRSATSDAASSTSIAMFGTNGDQEGNVRIDETITLAPDVRTLAVVVTVDGTAPTTCAPESGPAPGCTVVAVPSASLLAVAPEAGGG